MKEEVDWHAKFVDMRRKCRQANLGAKRNRGVIDGLAARYSNEFREKIQLRGELNEIKRENKALNTVLYQSLKKIEELEVNLDKLRATRNK
jgi:predicted RNase H-like nuclease (RuvC/YqgF family)